MTEVTVVIPTRDRPESLAAGLRALASQDDPPAFDVVVVDDSSAGDLVVDSPDGISIRAVCRSGGRGPGAARNAGWRATTADIVVFADDDVTPEPQWLRSVVDAFNADDVAVVEGPITTEAVSPVRNFLPVTAPGVGASGNVSYRRSVLEQLDGFDESLRHSEDVDLAWRARALGRMVWVAEAVVFHPAAPATPAAFARVARAKAGAQWQFWRKHPENQPLRSLRWSPTYVLAKGWYSRLLRDRRYRSDPMTALLALVIAVREVAAVVAAALREWPGGAEG